MVKNKYFKIVVGILCLLIVYGTGYIISGMNSIPPHFHTNFALFIGGEKFEFTADEYSEDVAACSIGSEVFPKNRVHLHENNGDTIHVHHDGVTWGHFFANNGITFSNTHISFKNGKRVLFNDEKNSMKFILNGKIIDDPYNRYMMSEDKLLVSYGPEEASEALSDLYSQVVSNAGEYNNKYDPGSCGGTNENSTLYLLRKMLHLSHH